MGFVATYLQHILFALNLLIVICGIILMVFGSTIGKAEDLGLEGFSLYYIAPYVTTMGVIIFLLGIFGCCCAYIANIYLLMIYNTISIVWIVVYLIFAILIFTALGILEKDLDKDITDFIRQIYEPSYNEDNSWIPSLSLNNQEDFKNKTKKPAWYWTDSDNRKKVDILQKRFECCGVEGGAYWTKQNEKIPDSCYKNKKQTKSNLYSEGCAGAYIKIFKRKLKKVGISLLAFVVIELISVVLTFMFVKKKGEGNGNTRPEAPT